MKRIEQKDLRAVYAPMPEATAVKLEGLLSALPEAEEEPVVKKKVSFALVLAAALVLLAVGAVATANWDVLTFLYGQEKPQMDNMLTKVSQTGTAEGVTLEIGTAMTDGRSLAFDWVLTIEDETLPVYLQTDRVSVAGNEGIWLDPVGGMNRVWIPKGETIRRNGELIKLAQPVQPGEEISVELTLGIYKPLREVVVFTSPGDKAKAEELAAQGAWTVLPENEIISSRQRSEKYPLWRYDDLSEDELADYERHEIRMAFTVTAPETEVVRLVPEEDVYTIGDVSVCVTEAYRTPMNIYAIIDLAVANAQNQTEAMQKAGKLTIWFDGEAGQVLQTRAMTGDATYNHYYAKEGAWHKTIEICTGAYDEATIPADGTVYLACYQDIEWKNGMMMLDKIGRYALRAE